ncbi:MAG: UDP-3-O-acyl-N-acetylglucosamine deacetylase, partial [Planctomycetaceae bacterium]|nr:UDP-3-O-acyl-N-acetylglucosamine deacetylase [Planctomycetaceae bacterium]
VAALLDAGIREQSSRRRVIVIGESEIIASPDGRGHISVSPTRDGRFQLTYELDYPQPVIGRQACSLDVTPTTFVRELSFARTFVLEGEVAAMRSQGFGKRATTDNLIVFSSDGPIDTELRAPDECARHKALDCIGDFSLVGCDLAGHVQCCGSGHALNHELIRRLEQRLRGCPPLSATG